MLEIAYYLTWNSTKSQVERSENIEIDNRVSICAHLRRDDELLENTHICGRS